MVKKHFLLVILFCVISLAQEFCNIDFDKIDKSKSFSDDYMLTNGIISIKYIDSLGKSPIMKCSEAIEAEHILACQALYYNQSYSVDSMWRDGLIPINGQFILECAYPTHVFKSYRKE